MENSADNQSFDSFVPDFLPKEFMMDLEDESQSLPVAEKNEYEDRLYRFEYVMKVQRFLKFVDDLQGSDYQAHHPFYQSLLWTAFSDLITDFGPLLTGDLIAHLPYDYWVYLSPLLSQYTSLTDQELDRRSTTDNSELKSVVRELRGHLQGVFQLNGDTLPAVESDERLAFLLKDGTHDQLVSLFSQFLQIGLRDARLRTSSWLRLLDSRLSEDPFTRFQLWVSLSHLSIHEPHFYPFYLEMMQPADQEAEAVDLLYLIDDILILFFEFILTGTPEDVRRLKTCFPEHFFEEEIERVYVWNQMEAFVEEHSLASRATSPDVLMLLDKFFGFFVLEDPLSEEVVYSAEILIEVHESLNKQQEESS